IRAVAQLGAVLDAVAAVADARRRVELAVRAALEAVGLVEALRRAGRVVEVRAVAVFGAGDAAVAAPACLTDAVETRRRWQARHRARCAVVLRVTRDDEIGVDARAVEHARGARRTDQIAALRRSAVQAGSEHAREN